MGTFWEEEERIKALEKGLTKAWNRESELNEEIMSLKRKITTYRIGILVIAVTYGLVLLGLRLGW